MCVPQNAVGFEYGVVDCAIDELCIVVELTKVKFNISHKIYSSKIVWN